MKKLLTIALMALSLTGANAQSKMRNNIAKQELKLTEKWDKVFPQSSKVSHKKITFVNRYGITLAADMFIPKNANGKLPAIAVAGPFGAVKEQCSGLYAQEMTERGFLTIAFDPSFTGESGGQPRYMASPDINTEDFQAAVDFLSTNKMVDANRIGIIGICGWGGIALNTAAIDTRVKATVTSTMYDMSRVNEYGYFDSMDEDARYAAREALNAQRTKDYAQGYYELGGGVIEKEQITKETPWFVKDYYDYYKTKRGYHERSLNSNGGWNKTGCISFLNLKQLQFSKEIRNAVMMIHGEKAHSRYFSETAYRNMTDGSKYASNKLLYIIPGASHIDLYDGGEKKVIPFGAITDFFNEYLR
ncbi:MAG: alpha/beta hydrolase [Prevotella sp.]|nr:alpha/beta hydrolase [Prevotella sp.]